MTLILTKKLQFERLPALLYITQVKPCGINSNYMKNSTEYDGETIHKYNVQLSHVGQLHTSTSLSIHQ